VQSFLDVSDREMPALAVVAAIVDQKQRGFEIEVGGSVE